MNRLDTTHLGGFPLALNDFRFIDDSVRLAIADLVNAVSGSESLVILYGCRMTNMGNYTSVSEGAIFYQGEIFHVFPHNFSGTTSAPYLNLIIENDPTGSKTFFDGTQHQVYEIRKAVGSAAPIQGAITTFLVSNAVRLNAIQTEITLADSGVSLRPDRNIPCKAFLRNGLVTIDAGVLVSSSSGPSSENPIAVVPGGFRPAYIIETPVAIASNSSAWPNYMGTIRIFPNGNIEIGTFPTEGSIYQAIFDIRVTYPVA